VRSNGLNKRSGLFGWLCAALCCAVFLATGCGKNNYFAGRNLPPSKLQNRVLIAIQNPGSFTKGALQMVDAFYDIRHSFDNKTPIFTINYSGAEPQTIQNLPENQLGYIYGAGDGGFIPINYATESSEQAIGGLAGFSSSIFITQNLTYIFAASQQAHVLTVIDRSTSSTKSYYLNLPGVFRISVNQAGSAVLAFVQNSDYAYRIRHLQANEVGPANAVDCEPQNLPIYCVVPVTDNSNQPIKFDRPTKAVFSPDGSTAYVLNCGPECGGTQASVSYLPVTGIIIQSGTPVPTGASIGVQATVSVPGGATNALADGNTLYVAGQQLQSDGLFSGNLTVVDTAARKAVGQYGISDGSHNKMILADDNTLWIGSQLCQEGERYKLAQAPSGAGAATGCLSMFNTLTKAVLLDSYKGDLTGLAAVTLLHKLYVAEGGQVRIYSTVDGHELDNTNVAVTGTAFDVAYMDAGSNGNNTDY
jgi:hypothetical protein